MTTPKAILAGFAMIAVAIVLAAAISQPHAQAAGQLGYAIAAGGHGDVFIVNQQTGKVAWCIRGQPCVGLN